MNQKFIDALQKERDKLVDGMFKHPPDTYAGVMRLIGRHEQLTENIQAARKALGGSDDD